ncbi:MAG TPA: hypothetical protein PKC95_00155, partial [Thauera aminoaromatica]|nr:hypothetical protein [Thauera aminoaromatica]
GVGVGRVATVAANLEPARCRGGADVRVRSRMVISLDDARPVAGATVDWRHAIDDDEEILRLLWAA